MSREVCGICWCPYDEDTGECACAPVQPRGAMNREDIERMAREAEVKPMLYDGKWAVTNLDRFAALVAAAERNAILQMSREQWFKTQADFEEAIRARESK